MKTRKIKEWHYSWYLKVLSIGSRLNARVILRESLNITRNLNPNCTPIHTISSTYYKNFIARCIPWQKQLIKFSLFLTSIIPFLCRKNHFVLKACRETSFLFLCVVNRSLHLWYNLHFYIRSPSHTSGNRTTTSRPFQSKKHLHLRGKSLLRFQRKHQTLRNWSLLWMTIWQELQTTSTKKKEKENNREFNIECNKTLKE